MEEIGRRLREAREAKSITLAQAEDDTKIRRKYLEALEVGRKADLPGEVYLKGFLRSYGNYLGLDGALLVGEYKQAKGEAEQQPDTAPLSETGGLTDAAPETTAPVLTAPRTPAFQPLNGTGGGGSLRSLGLILVGVLLVSAVGYFGWLVFQQVEPPPAVEPPPPVVATPEPTPPPPKLPDPPKVVMARGTGEDVIFTVPAGEILVKLELTAGAAWMQAEVDGKVTYEATTATPPEFKAAKQLKLRMGHMNGVSLTVNGQRFETPLQKGPYWLIFKAE